MKRYLSMLLAVVFIVSGACANDSEYGTQGNHLVPLLQSQISVKKELLRLQLKNDNQVEVDVYYEFYNPGKATTILMGFEGRLPYPLYLPQSQNSLGTAYISGFSINLNEETLPYQCAMVDKDEVVDSKGQLQTIDPKDWRYIGEDGFLKKSSSAEVDGESIAVVFAYYFNATFRPGVNKLHHHYTYTMGVSVERPYFFDYLLTPAIRWSNKQIDDFTLEIEAPDIVRTFVITNQPFGTAPPTITGHGAYRWINAIPYSYGSGTPGLQIALAGGKATFHIKNFKPSEELTIISTIPIPQWWNVIHTIDESPDSVFEIINECGYEDYLGYMASYFNDCGLDPKIRRIIRNLPYAARGHVFQDKSLESFYKSLWWYRPDPTGAVEQIVPLTTLDYDIIRYLKPAE